MTTKGKKMPQKIKEEQHEMLDCLDVLSFQAHRVFL
jgi:hypothetical protein